MMKNRKEISYSRLIEQCKSRINEIDKILDDDLISDEEFDRLEDEARRLTAEIGHLECRWRLINVKEIRPNNWLINFLKSFGDATTDRVITVKQYDVFHEINYGKPFKYNGLRYDVYRCNKNFGRLLITELIAE